MSEITQALSNLFQRHRIIFWYDAKQELQAEYEAVSLPGVDKVVIGNNQFGLKHRLLRQEPKQKFLLYHFGPQPNDLDNWLLDLQLAHGEFRADQAGLWLHELGLPVEFTDIMAAHADFFKSAQRRAALKALLKKDDTHSQIKLKMVAVCAAAEPRLDAILEHLLAELADGGDDKIRLIQRCDLEPFLWERAGFEYGYRSEVAGIQDFAITLFKSVYALGLEETAVLSEAAVVFLKRWKDSVRYRDAFAALSAEYAAILNIEQDLAARDYRQLIDLDIFELIDRKILSELALGAVKRTISSDTCARLVHQRRQAIWYDKYAHLYSALDKGAQFLHQLDQETLTSPTAADAIHQYRQTWFAIDQLYRQFVYHARQAGQQTLLKPLSVEIENRYTNKYLLPLNDRWQELVDSMTDWQTSPLPRQADFYEDQVAPFLRRDKKVFVIISDALRYEIGDELARRIRQEDRYEAVLGAAATLLPSYTQLGMAALLPHQALAIAEDGKSILVDGQNSAGTDNRSKILARATNGQGKAIQAQKFLNMPREESRTLFRDNAVVYIYHNRIDDVGDKRDSEERVFDAVENAIEELIKIIKKSAGANATNMLVTADHGFIYQHSALDESDFAGQQATGTEILAKNRRFVMGRGLVEGSSFKKFT
ncbi:MAG: BREX-1 system phosphatase PglZ type A, partial [Chloroflexi bacterium]|nr:BREX-1 system phosphatase PglZ type A [Chloroflexota bacterium]